MTELLQLRNCCSVSPPHIGYKLKLPAEVIEKGALSTLQLETICYACMSHNAHLDDGQRAGFLIGTF